MSTVDRAFRAFYRLIALALALAFAFIALKCAMNPWLKTDGAWTVKCASLLGTLLFSAFLGLFIVALFRLIRRAGGKAQRAIALLLFGGMAAVFAVVLLRMGDVRPVTDSFDDLETAYYLYRFGAVGEDFEHIRFVGMFGNNYLLILLFRCLFPLFDALGMERLLPCLYALNAGAILLAALLAWRFVRLTRGIRAANRFLALFALNPLYYPFAFWVYSLTLSLPIAMGLLLLGLRLSRARGLRAPVLPAAAFGILTALGYLIRPTSIFVCIAMLPVALQRCLSGGQWRRFAAILLIAALCLALALTGAKLAINRSFGDILHLNYPAAYWLSMGSHDSGGLSSNQEDIEFAESLDEGSRTNAAFLRKAVGNYRRAGLVGTLKLWARKTAATWSDGYSSLQARISSGTHNGLLYELTGGSRSHPFQCVCHAYRLLICVGVILSAMRLLRAKRPRADAVVCLVTLFGGVLFYMFWEAKTAYSAPFIPFMLSPAQRCLPDGNGSRARRPALRRAAFALAAASALAVCVAMPFLCLRRGEYTATRINSSNNTRVNKPVTASGWIAQTFEAEGPVNLIRLMCRVPQDSEPPISDYRATLYDDAGRALVSRTITAGDIHSSTVELEFEPVRSEGGYRLTIEKLSPDQAPLAFFTKYTYLLDMYPGELSSDERAAFPGDLMMDVCCRTVEPFLPARSVAAAEIAFLLFAGIGLTACAAKRTGKRKT